jgi:ribosome-associated toxin RatA of RatAB toxin-antitoxin module
MNTVNSETIQGDPGRIFELAARVEDWPRILPHYRAVEVLEPGDRERVVFMHCARRFGPLNWPCRWRARQELRPMERRILFHHLAGPAKGMEVEWRLTPGDEGVVTEIHHRLDHPLGRVYSDRIVGPLFVQAIAGETLRALKRIVEEKR